MKMGELFVFFNAACLSTDFRVYNMFIDDGLWLNYAKMVNENHVNRQTFDKRRQIRRRPKKGWKDT